MRTFVDKNDLHDGIERNVDLVRAHAVGTAVGRPVVTVAELLRVNVVVLGQQWGRRGQVRNFVNQRNDMISGRGDCWEQRIE